MKMRCKQPVKFTKADGTVAELCKSEEERRFLFKATGCTGGQQHLSAAPPILCLMRGRCFVRSVVI